MSIFLLRAQTPRLSKYKILFLGYGQGETTLIKFLDFKGCDVRHSKDKIISTQGYDLVISYGYKYIIAKDVIENSLATIINLHISYLPWNRGAHPNFWSFYDRTPSGVTIHLVDQGVDTGAIIFQRYVTFSEQENTYTKTYKKLRLEIEQLFKEHFEELVLKNYKAIQQPVEGTQHLSAELPKDFLGWDSDIYKEVARLQRIANNK